MNINESEKRINVMNDYLLRFYKLVHERDLDCLVLVPTHRSENVVEHVVSSLVEGFNKYFPNMNVTLFITGEMSLRSDFVLQYHKLKKLGKNKVKIVGMIKETPYQGKAWSLYAGMKLLELFYQEKKNKNLVFFNLDSDIRNITPEWVKSFLEPILFNGIDLVYSSYEVREYKEDDRSLNDHFVAPMMTAITGERVREVEGEFAMKFKVVEAILNRKDIWSLQHPHLTFVPTASSLNFSFHPVLQKRKLHHWNEFPFSRFPEYAKSMFSEAETFLYLPKSEVIKEILPYPKNSYPVEWYLNSNFCKLFEIYKKQYYSYEFIYNELINRNLISKKLRMTLHRMSLNENMFVKGLNHIQWTSLVVGMFRLYLLGDTNHKTNVCRALTPCLVARVVGFERKCIKRDLSFIRKDLDIQDDHFFSSWIEMLKTLKRKQHKYNLNLFSYFYFPKHSTFKYFKFPSTNLSKIFF